MRPEAGAVRDLALPDALPGRAPVGALPDAPVGALPDATPARPGPGPIVEAGPAPPELPRAATAVAVATSHDAPPPPLDAPAPRPAPALAPAPFVRFDDEDPRPSCTVAQLRRFIKSRPWVPMHELRRRFGIYGGDDDVSPIRVGDHTLYIGLPAAEARLMAELLGGDVGYELSLDPVTPVVVGVYPMRPVPRG